MFCEDIRKRCVRGKGAIYSNSSDKSGVSRLVEDLVRNEYVTRQPAATDRRFVTLNLLPKGQERFEKIENDMYYRFKEVLEQILEEKANAYKISEDFMNRFIEKNGTVVCKELLGYDLSKLEDAKKIRELDLFKVTCPKMIQCATEIVEEMLQE